jgi:hypothetical protein
MKAETLLTLLKKCVLCLFLCVPLKVVGQVEDSSRISLAVSAHIRQAVKSIEKQSGKVQLSGDSSIIRYIPSYYLKRDSGIQYNLTNLHAVIEGNSVVLSYLLSKVQWDFEPGTVQTARINSDSLLSTLSTISDNEEESFWDDTLQPILVTAGAAAVIALFFFVKF